jgi:RNA polymerase sigma-70 factor (ECF subfamily)
LAIVDITGRTRSYVAPEPLGREVIRRAAAGEHAAWEHIFRRVYPNLAAFAARRVGPDAADDIVNETMSRAVAGIGRFRWTNEGIEPWIFGIARKVVADHHRRAGRRRRGDAAVPSAGERPGPMELVVLGEEHDAVRAAFDTLPAADREILELRLIAGLTPEQVAAVIGKRPGAVRTAQTRALARLRRLLEQS